MLLGLLGAFTSSSLARALAGGKCRLVRAATHLAPRHAAVITRATIPIVPPITPAVGAVVHLESLMAKTTIPDSPAEQYEIPKDLRNSAAKLCLMQSTHAHICTYRVMSMLDQGKVQ